MTVILQSCQPYSLSQTNEHAKFHHIKRVVWLSFMKPKPINIVKLIRIKHQAKLQHNAAKKIVLFFLIRNVIFASISLFIDYSWKYSSETSYCFPSSTDLYWKKLGFDQVRIVPQGSRVITSGLLSNNSLANSVFLEKLIGSSLR